MNLFANDTKALLQKYMTEDWAEAISNHLTADVFLYIREKLGYLRKTVTVYPESADVFKALKSPLSEVKVVIVGQDPYHNGNADGIAFSCKLNLSPSLAKIIPAIMNDDRRGNNLPPPRPTDIGDYLMKKDNLNLQYLTEQGVLLYNPTLTVERGFPGSHKDLWIPFSKAVFNALNEQRRPIVWMLWGNEAQKAVRDAIKVTNPKHLHLMTNHPAAAAYKQEVWSCDHFYKTNVWLKERNINEIKWLK